MLTITGNGRLTRDPELRHTPSGKTVTTVCVASDRRDRSADPLYPELVLWERAAEAAVEHLTKGQSVTFSGRLELRPYTTRDDDRRVALEVHHVDLEYGPRAHRDPAAAEPGHDAEPVTAAPTEPELPF